MQLPLRVWEPTLLLNRLDQQRCVGFLFFIGIQLITTGRRKGRRIRISQVDHTCHFAEMRTKHSVCAAYAPSENQQSKVWFLLWMDEGCPRIFRWSLTLYPQRFCCCQAEDSQRALACSPFAWHTSRNLVQKEAGDSPGLQMIIVSLSQLLVWR